MVTIVCYCTIFMFLFCRITKPQSISTSLTIPPIDFRGMFNRDLAVQMSLVFGHGSKPLEQGLLRLVLSGSLRYNLPDNTPSKAPLLEDAPPMLVNGAPLDSDISQVCPSVCALLKLALQGLYHAFVTSAAGRKAGQ